MNISDSITEKDIADRIYIIRGQKVMIDRDLADLYEVETRILKQAVKRNNNRFPADFMFEMTTDEFADWKSQIVMSKSDRQGLRHIPTCFTEPGVAMLSSILNSDRAIQVNIQIIRIFIKMRQLLSENAEILLAIEKIKSRLDSHDKSFELVFHYLDELASRLPQATDTATRKRIGYKSDDL